MIQTHIDEHVVESLPDIVLAAESEPMAVYDAGLDRLVRKSEAQQKKLVEEEQKAKALKMRHTYAYD